MQNKYLWLSLDVVVDINRTVIENSKEGPEPFALLDQGKLEGAMQRPLTKLIYGGQDGLVTLSVEYMLSIANAHAFIQGNKRTGFAAGDTFLLDNGYNLTIPDIDYAADFFTDVVTTGRHIEQFTTYLEMNIEPSEI